MRKLDVKRISAYLLCICALAAVMSISVPMRPSAYADGGAEERPKLSYAVDYSDAYRNRLQFSASRGWNNDPNGLVYVDGVYHMYYQYAWNAQTKETSWSWADMSWGHATSTDLVHWQERRASVDGDTVPKTALPAYTTDKDGNYYAMMFSGSAVYDENNTSGFFDVDEDGKVVDGQGIVAMLTQPRWDKDRGCDAQRQIVAYSKDGGDTFAIYGEVIAGIDNGDGGYEEFRDPKLFWSEEHGKWLCAVGGGKVRMYASDDLREFDLIGETGYWGECPDISKFETEVDGEKQTKYALIVSPEDKAESHEHNGTTRADAFYPAEYYVIGELDGDGLFVSDMTPKRLSEGLDSYAFQSFNNAPDGRVYGVSWSACWKNVDEYKHFRRDHNGGVTVACELGLVQTDDGYRLERKPVAAIKELRGDKFASFDGALEAGENALDGATADVADFEIELDFTGSDATGAEIALRASDFERTTIAYDVKTGALVLDRGESSLIARDTYLYNLPAKATAALDGGKLKLRVLLDRAFISVFANDGEASIFSAIFPSAQSVGLSLTADGDIKTKVDAYRMNDIYGGITTRDDLYVSANTVYEGRYVGGEILGKINTAVGATEIVSAYSYALSFDPADISWTVTSGADAIELNDRGDGTAEIAAKRAASAEIRADYRGQSKRFVVYVYENGYDGLSFKYADGGEAIVKGDGLHLARAGGDAFRFADSGATEFVYSAKLTRGADAPNQAGGLVFGVSENLKSYYVATADFKDNVIKLWQAGVGDLETAEYELDERSEATLTVIATDGTVRIYIDGDDGAELALEYDIEDFAGGYYGINVYNADIAFTDVAFTDIRPNALTYDFGALDIFEVKNADDGKRLTVDDYTLDGGRVTLDPEYISTLDMNREYTLTFSTEYGDFELGLKTAETENALSVAESVYYEKGDIALRLTGGGAVNKVTVDGKSVKYTVDGETVTIDGEVFDGLRYGAHIIKVYLDGGRLSASFTYADRNAEIEPVEPPEPVSYTFLIIDLCIFAAIALVFAVASYIGRRKKRMS